jgi:hypothetical protein
MFAILLFAKDPSESKHGKLLNLDIGSQSKVPGVNGIVTTRISRVFTYSVDGGDRVYDGQEVSRRDGYRPVEYAIDRDHLYLKDSDGKSHRLDLVRTTSKQ